MRHLHADDCPFDARPYAEPFDAPARGSGSLLETLEALEADVRRQVEREEGPCGFFAFVAHAAPRYASMLERLHDEHCELVDRVVALRRRAEIGSGSAADVRIAFQVLIMALEEHDALEREILRDALEP
jgi:hypothetical protein